MRTAGSQTDPLEEHAADCCLLSIVTERSRQGEASRPILPNCADPPETRCTNSCIDEQAA